MFQSNDIFSSQTQGYVHDASLKFVPQPQTYNRYSLDIDKSNAVRLAEIFVEHDENGTIRAANYDSGAQVRKLDSYTVVKAANNTLWMGDRFGGWHPID
ncbi:MAG: hypothetical protein C0507_05840 [Cyanobacteria bacterium PR.3.49]|jgi:hypothetical protein|nr:hypothetical protein [Cyanobacteria bacterium PR.3.49]